MPVKGLLTGACIALPLGIALGIGWQTLRSTAAPEPLPGPPATPGIAGIGGIFFRSKDPEATRRWYQDNLAIPTTDVNGMPLVIFQWREVRNTAQPGNTVWSPMPRETPYFDSKDGQPSEFMINYRVRDLDALLLQLRAKGISVSDSVSKEFNGRFAWIVDLDGRKVELWEPAPGF